MKATRVSVASVCVMLALPLLLMGCGGGGDGSEGADGATGTGLKLSSSVPANGAVDVLPTGSVILNFSAPLDASTATANTVSLRNAAGAQDAVVSATGSTLTVTSAAHLLPSTRYTVSVTNALRGAGGEQLSAALNVDFTTKGAWQGEVSVGNGGGRPATPRLAVDAHGNALLVWSEYDGTRSNIWSSSKLAGTSWTTPELIEDSDASAYGLRVAMDAAGNAMVVWVDDGGVWSNRYVAGAGWETPRQISSTGTVATLAMDPSGNALAAWSDDEEGIWWSRYTPDAGWGTASALDKDNSYCGVTASLFDCAPEIAMDSAGNAIVVWFDTSDESVRASRYTAGSWGPVVHIDAGGSGASPPQIAMSKSGEAIAVWRQLNANEKVEIWANLYKNGSGWGAAEHLNKGANTCTSEPTHLFPSACQPDVAFDAMGSPMVLWARSGVIMAARYAANGGWSAPESLATQDAGRPLVVADPAGNFVAVWASKGSPSQLLTKRYIAGTGWMPAAILATAGAKEAIQTQHVTAAPDGSVYVSWVAGGASGQSLWSNQFE